MKWSGFCPLATVLLLGLACAPEEPLDAHALLASTPSAVQARLETPSSTERKQKSTWVLCAGRTLGE